MLSLTARKILIGIHILLVSIWIGTLIVIVSLLLLKYSAFTLVQIEVVDKFIFLLFDSIVMNVSIAVAITGLIFAMFTNWGFIKFYWIITKWTAIVILAIIIMFISSPSINGMAALSDIFKENVIGNGQYVDFEQQAILYTTMQLIILIFIVFISTLKPWGQRRVRRNINRKVVISTGVIIGILLGASATSQYLQLTYYRNLQINEVNLKKINDGYYIGKVDYSFEYEVGVSIKNHSIKDINFLKNRKSHYAKLAEGIKQKILREQKINIDAVTGATTTSQILLRAVEVAIRPNK